VQCPHRGKEAVPAFPLQPASWIQPWAGVTVEQQLAMFGDGCPRRRHPINTLSGAAQQLKPGNVVDGVIMDHVLPEAAAV